jgi:hypothetical protein
MPTRKICLWLLAAVWLVSPGSARADAVRAFQQDHAVVIKEGDPSETVPQQRWVLENEAVRLAVTDDPGGAVVEFVNKRNGVNHVAGEVYSRIVKGKPDKKIGYGWKEQNVYDNATDPVEKHLIYQPFQVAFVEGEAGAKTIKVTGQTGEQRLERWHTLRPGSAELLVKSRLTNISNSPRRLWLRWHPYAFVSGDTFGDSACVLVPGEGAQVRKIRIGWGWDHSFMTSEGYWMAGDFKSGDGLFMTFEQEKQPLIATWTDYGKRSERKGSVVLEPLPPPVIRKPGEFEEASFTYFPFSRDTDSEAIPLGLVKDPAAQARARAFLAAAKPVSHLAMINAYTFARSLQFDWEHRRRDLFGLRDWGFADCAIVGFPTQGLPLRVRMVGGVFDEVRGVKPFGYECPLVFVITMTDKRGQEIYRNTESFPVCAGIPGQNAFDREIAVPTTGIPDGTYALKVEALDPVTGKPFHSHQMESVVFGKRMEAEAARRAALPDEEPPRPFVTALAALADVKVENGRVAIPIGVEEGGGVSRRDFPVRLGVPFPQGAFPTNVPVRLLAPDGHPVAAQYAVMNVWPDKSLKWLQVEFPATCPANGHVFYRLEAGGTAQAAVGPDLATAFDDRVELNTGAMLLRLGRTQAAVPGEVFLDSNGDGRFDAGELAMPASQPGDAWWVDGNGAKFALQLSGDPVDGRAPGVWIERNGPLAATVRLMGWYLDKDGRRAALGEVRIEATKGKPVLKIWHRVTYTGNPWRDRLKGYGLTLRVTPEAYSNAVFELDGEPKAVAAGGELRQKAADVAEIVEGGRTLVKGRRASGAVALAGAGGQALVYHLNLWQMHPKRIGADLKQGAIAIDYWPIDAETHSYAPYEEFWIPSSSSSEACGTGASRVQEIVVDFSGAVAPAQAEAVYSEPVVACTPPKWVQQTRVLNSLYPYDPAAYPDVERYLSLVVDFYNQNRDFFQWYGQWDYGTLHNDYMTSLYQWLVRGRYANIGNEEDIVQGPWLAWFRSGDRKYLKFATLWTRHLMETQSIRWSDLYPEYAGMSRRHHYTPWLSSGDFGHTMLCPYLEYYHATGYAPAWEMARLTAKSMSNARDGEWRYISNPLIGSIRMYLETGEPEYKATADRLWNDLMAPDRNDWYLGTHGSRMAIWYAPFNKDCMRAWKEWSKDGRPAGDARPLELDALDSLGELGELTGDDYYAHRARLAFDGFRATYTGQLRGVNPVFRGMFPAKTQFVMGNFRMAPQAAGQIAKSKRLFPAEYYGLSGIREIVVQKDQDGPFDIWINARDGKTLKIEGPDGKPVAAVMTLLFDYATGKRKVAPTQLVKLTVPADGRTGCYRLPVDGCDYLACSLKRTALRAGKTLRSGNGAALYARTDDLGGKNARIIMRGTPGNSFEVFSQDGKRLFSETTVRPENDAIGIEHRLNLPPGTVVRLGDKVGVTFPDLDEIPLFLNPDGLFDLPPAKR